MNVNDKKTEKRSSPHFNILDALIVFLVVLCVVGIVFRGNIRDKLGFGQDLTEYMISFKLSAVDGALPDHLDVGNILYLADGSEAGRLLGVTDFSVHSKESAGSTTLLVRPASVYMNDTLGGVVLATYPKGTIVDAKGAFIAYGAYCSEGYFCLGGERYLAVGQQITIYTDKVTLNMTITGITPVQ